MFQSAFCELFNIPWQIEPAAHGALVDEMTAAIRGGVSPELMEEIRTQGMANTVERPAYAVRDGVALMSVAGVTGRKLGMVQKFFGGTDTEDLMQSLASARVDAEVHSIVIQFHTPGGQVVGTEETARAIQAANAEKPVVGYAPVMAASCGQWLMAACGASYAAPSAMVGSVGVYLSWMDTTRALEALGVDVVKFQGGKHKGIGFAGRPVTEADREMLQAQVDEQHARFRAAVRTMRGVDIEDKWMEGQTLTGREAEGIGMIDGTVDTLGEVLEAMRADW